MLTMHVLACGWLIIEEPFEVMSFTSYNKAYYWVVTTLTTVGYGDITPTSNIGRVYTSIVMLLGVGVYGLVISQMSRLILIRDRRKEEINEKMDHLTSFFRHYNIPDVLQHETRAFYDHILSKKINKQEKELLADMPTKLKNELQIHMVHKPISQTKIFSGCSIRDMRDVMAKLENLYVSPGEKVFEKGDSGDSMYIIVHGHVEIFNDDGHIADLHQNQIFGEMSLVMGEKRTATAEATSYLDLIRLSKDNFEDLIKTHPKIKHNVDEIINTRKKRNN
jgi:voltage-gated potassium channel